jgi:hypothetical protein
MMYLLKLPTVRNQLTVCQSVLGRMSRRPDRLVFTQSIFTRSIFTQSIFTQSIVTPNIITRSHNLLLLVHTLHGPVDIDLREYDDQHHALHLLGLLPLEPVQHFLEHVLAAHGVSLPACIRGHVVSLEGHFGQIRPRLAPQGQHN